jgi:hypothetical protein
MQMVRRLYLLVLGFALFGCNDGKEIRNDNVRLLSFNQSECKGNKSAMIDENDEILIVRSTGDDIYTIQHLNVMFNCCLPAGLTVEVKFQNDTIFCTEREKELGTCRCLCPYDLSGEIGNLESGEYVLCLIKETNRLGTITLDFKNNMNEEILVSELKDYPYL